MIDNSDSNALTFATLRAANATRPLTAAAERDQELCYRGNELAGETGKVCDAIKRIRDQRQEAAAASIHELVEALANVVVCVDAIAHHAGIDLGAAVAAKLEKPRTGTPPVAPTRGEANIGSALTSLSTMNAQIAELNLAVDMWTQAAASEGARADKAETERDTWKRDAAALKDRITELERSGDDVDGGKAR